MNSLVVAVKLRLRFLTLVSPSELLCNEGMAQRSCEQVENSAVASGWSLAFLKFDRPVKGEQPPVG